MSLARDHLVQYLDSTLVGPEAGPTETLRGLPTKRYLMGILFPREASTDAMVAEEQTDVVGASDGELLADDPVALAGQWLPASIGFSCFVAEGAELTCAVWGARYQRTESKTRSYVRVPIAERDAPQRLPLPQRCESVLEGRAELRVRRRTFGSGTLFTITLVNALERSDENDPPPEDCLFQVGLSVTADRAAILEYPSVALLSRDSEEQELRLMYRHAKTFAVGHGCAVTWRGGGESAHSEVAVDLMPRHVVQGVTQSPPEGLDVSILDVARLGDSTVDWSRLRGELDGFVQTYEDFVNAETTRQDVPTHLEEARERIANRLDRAARRMRAGIDCLDDPVVRRAWQLANRAMAVQRARVELVRSAPHLGRDATVKMDDDATPGSFAWHPFQLAFQLLTLPSLVDPTDDDRETVDLIWFPTGGGKTEAYLAVAATEIFLRRLRLGAFGGGTAVLTRYTLRLLTTQQFERAAATICACERLRSDAPQELGEEPITIGLWIGDESVPNHYSTAADKFLDARESERPMNPFQLERCPWCGTSIFPARGTDDDGDYGVRADVDGFAFFCPHARCPFHDELPIQVIDAGLFDNPPTLLLGTVDKFAQLTWRSAGGAFFGDDGRFAPPSLIIQDELHLLSGPLGTTVGVYEAAIGALCARTGTPPKIVASTATIRRAGEQVSGLFGGRAVALFPPSGVDAGNSFFARNDLADPGRLYVGVMAQSHTLSTAMVHLSAALLQGAVEVDMDEDSRDAYWTLVAYHNSLRELGRTVTLERDDVPARIEGIARDRKVMRQLGDEDVVELTGNVSGTSEALRRMAAVRASGEAISVLACTNMLSVGVDVARLGLMVVNGQPKTASEYIQATSRVGRGKVPGLVIALFTATKPRDRSHYEAFRPFHGSLYRHVEPTSVTPWSAPSRRRALHAAFVLLVRQLGGLLDDRDAHRFDPKAPAVATARDVLLAAVEASDPDELDEAGGHLDRCTTEWLEAIETAAEENKVLHFRSSGRGVHSLLRNFGERGTGWETLNSMRSVDKECRIAVRGEDA